MPVSAPVAATGVVAIPAIGTAAALFALSVVVIIGLDLLMRAPRRREEGKRQPMQSGNVDPVSLRRRRPLTQRLSGAALIAAAIVLFIVIRPFAGL